MGWISNEGKFIKILLNLLGLILHIYGSETITASLSKSIYTLTRKEMEKKPRMTIPSVKPSQLVNVSDP